MLVDGIGINKIVGGGAMGKHKPKVIKRSEWMTSSDRV